MINMLEINALQVININNNGNDGEGTIRKNTNPLLLTRIIYFSHGRKRRMYLNSRTALYLYIYNYIQFSIERYT